MRPLFYVEGKPKAAAKGLEFLAGRTCKKDLERGAPNKNNDRPYSLDISFKFLTKVGSQSMMDVVVSSIDLRVPWFTQ